MHKLEEWLMDHFIEFIFVMSAAWIILVVVGLIMS